MRHVFAILTLLTLVGVVAAIVAGEFIVTMLNGFGAWWFWRELRRDVDNAPAPLPRRELGLLSVQRYRPRFKPRDPSEDAINAARDAEHFDRDMRSAIAKYAKETSQP